MHLARFSLLLILAMCLALAGCGGDAGVGPTGAGGEQPLVVMDTLPLACGMPKIEFVHDEAGKPLGLFEFSNDTTNLYFNYAPPQGFSLQEVSVYVGAREDMPMKGGAPDYDKFPIRFNGLAQGQHWLARMPWASMPACVQLAARVKVEGAGEHRQGWVGANGGDGSATGIEYCRRLCRVAAVICTLGDAGKQPVTMPQSMWNSPSGLAVADVLRDQFPKLYPKGLAVGCDYTLRYSTADELLKALPMQQPAAAFTANASAPNALAGELFSLMAVIRLDEMAPGFSHGSTPLRRLEVSEGAFEGWLVDEISREASSVLGGCTSNYRPEQLLDVVAQINASFSPGNAPTGFLRCPKQ